MSLCVDDRLVCSYTCIPDGLKGKITIFYLEIVDLKQESGTKSFERWQAFSDLRYECNYPPVSRRKD